MTLWNKDTDPDHQMLQFTVGNDHILDLKLLQYDCIGSIAHAEALGKVGVLTDKEVLELTQELETIKAKSITGNFPITQSQEDGHTAIEQELIKKLGETGKKIHTGRSRNDQVLTALRLYMKDALSHLSAQVIKLQESMHLWQEKHKSTPLPGFTHTRKAMPSCIEMWCQSFQDAMDDDLIQLEACVKLIDQSPLGTGAGYGVSLPLDRAMTAKRMGFSRVQENGIYAQHSRTKLEGTVLFTASQIMVDLNRIASDIIFFTLPELDFLEIPEAFTTGSSIMPHKKNPDLLELIRAKYHRVLAWENSVRSLGINLISGYHRDYQLSKEPLMQGLETVSDCLDIITKLFQNLDVKKESCKKAMTAELYSVERAYELVKQGVPFREAYQIIAQEMNGSGM